jgi:hypothetical protein
MEEREVLRKLGFTSETEEQARKELNSVEQLKRYELKYAEEDENYYNLLSNNTEKELGKVIKSFSAHHQLILPIFHYAYGRIIITGWRTCLKEDAKYPSQGKRREESWIKIRRKLRGSAKNNVDDLMDESLSHPDESQGLALKYHIDIGHVLGEFTKLTPLISDFLGSDQNSDNINTYPQFKPANENADKDNHNYGQLYFERKAINHKPCYYEAEAICKSWNDVVPIGTRIRIIDINNLTEISHVFIPNFDWEKDDNSSTYKNFFENGSLDNLKTYNN